MLVLITSIVILALTLLHLKLRYGRIGRYIAKIPGPPGFPIIGNFREAWVSSDKLWDLIAKLDKEYYPLYKMYFINEPVITILEPENAEILLTSAQHIEKSSMYHLLHCWFGTGLLTSSGSKWQTRRKILTPAFHFNVLQKYLEIVLENDDKFVKSLREKGESIQNLIPLITNYTLNVICESAMGTSLQGKEEMQKSYRKAVYDMGNIVIYRITRPWLQSSTIFNLTSKGPVQREALKVLHEFSSNMIEERKQYHDATEGRYLKNLDSKNSKEEVEEEEVEVETSGYRKKRLAMLDLLIAAHRNGGQIDDEGIREEVDTFTFEGHDTSAMGLCFALLLIAEHKDVQERIRSEVDRVLSASSGRLGMSEINQLNYLDRCVKESLRLYPSVPFISRYLKDDLRLKEYIVPSGSSVELHIYQIHRDPNYWPDPKKFDPDRFLPERAKGRHPFAYIPFSAGPRNCIGQKFAMMELKALIAHVVHNFHLEPIDFAHEVPIMIDIVLRPARPVHVKFIPRDK